ncbi:MAG TPA: pyridoxal phosphate-dependent aminotransferase family protein [Sandaracinaceae bacterium LLY-WYZ-13_1]|nr:pyridoxal phosphate-dependent aminotransferase family protein [Sandaracinaceae bacterium LLY-WYZ-13_1]
MSTDLFDKCRTDGGSFGRYRSAGERFFHKPYLDGLPGPRTDFEGREVVTWSVNSYLGFAGHPEVWDAARASVDRWGLFTPMGSRLMTGNTRAHEALEARLADWLGREAAVVFNYGYLGVMGTIESLVGRHDEVVIDRESHACIYDGAIAATPRRRFHTFAHNDVEDLERLLARLREGATRGILIVTEGVFGMRGDLAPLPAICDLKDRYDARLLVDDAHGFGVMGEGGRGAAEHLGVQDRVDLCFGTFAKAFAAIGGVTAGPRDVVDWISCNARTHVFAKALPRAYVDTLSATFDAMEREGPARRARMWAVARRLQHGLRDLGYDLGVTQSPITPVMVPAGDVALAESMVRYLREEHAVFVSGVTYPGVPKGVVLFRLIPTAAHSDEDVDRTLAAFEGLRDTLGLSRDARSEVA